MVEKKIKKTTENSDAKIKKISSKKQKEENNKTLLWILTGLGLFLLIFFLIYFFVDSEKSFEYKGVKFNIVQEGQLTLYNTQLPVYDQERIQISTYNFYLRTDPRKLAKLDFNETVEPLRLVALNYSDNIDCDGYGIVALTNVINLYNLMESKVVIDKNATCDPDGKYMFVNMQKTNENKIERNGNCYNLKVNGCDLFPTTERFMLDTFVKIKEYNITIISLEYVAK